MAIPKHCEKCGKTMGLVSDAEILGALRFSGGLISTPTSIDWDKIDQASKGLCEQCQAEREKEDDQK